MSTNETPNPSDMPQQAPTESAESGRRQNVGASASGDSQSAMDGWPKDAVDAVKALRKESARYRERAKLAADDAWYQRATTAVDELDKIENARKSAEQRLTEERDQAAARASDLESNVTRLRAALNAGFTGDDVDDIAHRLQGSTFDELAEDARKLRGRFASPSTSDGVRPDPSQGTAALPLNGDPLASMLASKLR